MGGLFRPIFELLITIGVVLLARSVLGSILRSFARAASESFNPGAPNPGSPNPGAPNPGVPRAGSANSAQSRPTSSSGGDLHKDPVCGTYVAEGAALKRQLQGQTFYYCSKACYEKHSLVAR
jgi:YHS domain-containing protein